MTPSTKQNPVICGGSIKTLKFLALLSLVLPFGDNVIVSRGLAAGPEIIRLEYRACVDTDDYTITTTNLYRELAPASVPQGTLSDTWGIGATRMVTIQFTVPAPQTQFCVESTPVLGAWEAPWAAVSAWQPATGTNTYSCGVLETPGNGLRDSQRFFRVRTK